MLSPNTRSLYTAALTPPPGFVFDEAIGATYSLDPSVLLTVPVHLALLGGQGRDAMLDGIAVHESIRKLANRIAIYAQRGRLLVPSPPNPLYGLLESMVVEVTAPRGGAFHPKFWLIRFTDPQHNTVVLRLLILSRNLTGDRSWDIALTLEGKPTNRRQARNRELARLIADLPAFAVDKVDDAKRDQAVRLAGELYQTEWVLPPGFDDLSFHVLGRKARRWKPGESDMMAIISPFCTDAALQHLCKNTKRTAALVSRPETLLALNAQKTHAIFDRLLVLDDAAETEDGEDVEAAHSDTYGLHAKVYVIERRANTHLVLGSANATNAALVQGQNIEVLAELVGKTRSIGGVETLLGAGGFGEVLVQYAPPAEPAKSSPEEQAAEKALEAARDAIARSQLWLECSPAAEGSGTWDLKLLGLGERCADLAAARAWAITLPPEHAVDLWPRSQDNNGPAVFPHLAAASITGLIAFELEVLATVHKRMCLRFVLNLPVVGLPEERDAAILQTVIRNRDGFVRYLLMLLGDLGMTKDIPGGDGAGSYGIWWRGTGRDGTPLLEELVRAYSREPERLREAGQVIHRLTKSPVNDDLLPVGFLDLWRVFEEAMERRNE